MYGYDSRVRLSEVDQDRRMTLNAILNSFQDCSSFHSEDLGVGAAFVEQKKRMWVLSSWKIVIQRYPELAESIRVETSPYEFSKLTGRRNFRMLDEGERCSHVRIVCGCIWMLSGRDHAGLRKMWRVPIRWSQDLRVWSTKTAIFRFRRI